MKKIFILSANSMASSPDSLLRFGNDNEVVVPMPCIDELANIATQYNEKGRNARKVLEYLDSFSFGKLCSKEGIKQINCSILRVETGYRDINIVADNLSINDKRRLQIAIGLKEDNRNKKTPVILISKNPAFRLKAKSLGIRAQNYKDEVFPALAEQYKGRISCTTTVENLQEFYKNGSIKVKKVHSSSTIEWVPNLFVEMTAINSNGYRAVGRFDGEKIVKLAYENYHPFGISAKNSGQIMLIEAMMIDSSLAPIVIVKGGAGTGKTYQTLACALEQAYEEDVYEQIMISTSVATVGQEEIGFLPGEIKNKFSPHIGGVRDNLRILLNSRKKSKKDGNPVEDGEYLFETGVIQMQPIGFFRGRTIVNTFCIIDETQNISPDDIKSIVSRAGENSKFIFLGDPTQIDNPKLNETYNGLVFLSEKMKGYKKAWQITLNEEESVRSELAKFAAKNL